MKMEVLKMAGYNGYSMSNNAVSAYEDGERPISKWTKGDIISFIESAVKNDGLALECDLDVLKKASAKVLKDVCLSRSSWHHTSSRYNRTNFYIVDLGKVEALTNEQLSAYVPESEPADEKWKCAFLEWTGTRKHPKTTEYVEVGVVKGDWFIREDGSKKKTSAKGFRFIERIQ
jgi:hypothetical protein